MDPQTDVHSIGLLRVADTAPINHSDNGNQHHMGVGEWPLTDRNILRAVLADDGNLRRIVGQRGPRRWGCVNYLLSANPGRTPADPHDATLVPLLIAVVFGLLAWRFDLHFDLLPWSVLAAFGTLLGVIDLVEYRLPNPLIYSATVLIGLLLLTSAALHARWPDLLRGIAAMSILASCYLAIAVISHGGLGAGDVKLGGLLGLTLGWIGWPALVAATLLGWSTAALASLLLRITGQRPRHRQLAMGPFLVLTALLTASLTGADQVLYPACE